ncbi:hypothetical protein HPB49_005305 [Dermacentor silvarum]|uniref:Uncharacterized protein n=1 Tax=Dermacentor silvarum TaxID=543639 RepID=A0ACB8DNJ8_DERSI|nr:hypothetical protein HPB49_005305 [Dermacentor silvarum]
MHDQFSVAVSHAGGADVSQRASSGCPFAAQQHGHSRRATRAAVQHAEVARLFEETTRQLLSSRSGEEARQDASSLAGASVSGTALADACPQPNLACNANKKYREADGSCNNLQNPGWGRAGSCMTRLLTPAYSDGVGKPRVAADGSALPNARKISYTVHPDVNNPATDITHMVMQFGQFIDHDLALAPQEPDPQEIVNLGNPSNVIDCCSPSTINMAECFSIAIPADDPFFAAFGKTCMNMPRSAPCTRCTLGTDGYREQQDILTSYIDTSQIYGSSQNDTMRLRLLQGGDERVNEHPGLTSVHTIWLRHHNLLARYIGQYVNANDETLFQLVKSICQIDNCQHVVSGDHGGNLERHLQRRHKEVYDIILADKASSTKRVVSDEVEGCPAAKLRQVDMQSMFQPTSSKSFSIDTAEHLTSQVKSTLSRYDLSVAQVYNVTTDNGANMLKAARLLGETDHETDASSSDEEADSGYPEFEHCSSLLDNAEDAESRGLDGAEFKLGVRRIVESQFQHIVYSEWLPVIIGPDAMSYYQLVPKTSGFTTYDPSVDATMINEFAAAAFRLGHTLINGSFLLDTVNGLFTFDLQDNYFFPFNFYNGDLDDVLLGLIKQRAQTFEKFVTTGVTRHLYRLRNESFGLDLIAINIQRAREHGIRPYVDYVKFCGNIDITSFDQLKQYIDNNVVELYKQLYK